MAEDAGNKDKTRGTRIATRIRTRINVM